MPPQHTNGTVSLADAEVAVFIYSYKCVPDKHEHALPLEHPSPKSAWQCFESPFRLYNKLNFLSYSDKHIAVMFTTPD